MWSEQYALRVDFKLRNDFGHTFVIVTHNAEFAAMADRKIEIKDGVVLD